MRRLWGVVAVCGLWELAGWVFASPLLPRFTQALLALLKLSATGELWLHASTSLLNVCLGFVGASVLGIALGVAIALFPLARDVMMPLVDSMRPIAALTLFPLIILVLGLGRASKVFVIFWTAWPAVVLNTAQGLSKVDPSVRESAQTEGAGTWDLLGHVTFPLALPTIMTGLRIGLSGGWISLIASEMLGGSKGLGYSILSYSQTFRFPEMYATILLIALLGLAMNVVLAAIQRRLDYEEDDHESRFLRFGDRAVGWALDSLLDRSRPTRA